MSVIIAAVDKTSHTFVSGSQVNGQVFINLFDAATGLPISGPITIYYNQNINGVTTAGSAYITGQSAPIYSGLIQDTATDYYADWNITGQSSVTPPPPTPPVGTCDLTLANIVVNQNESSPGADDASITVNATSSYLPIQYSLDNSTWQNSPTFAGISGGFKTVYLKDNNPGGSCMVNGGVTIPILRNLLVSDPGVSVSSNTSRWNAAFNPIVFTYQRKDFEVTAASLYNTGGVTGTTLAINGDLTVLAAAVASNIIAGPNGTPLYVYVNAGPYAGVYLVIDCTINSVSIAATYSTTAAGFMNSDNIKPYYKIRTQIKYNDPVTGTPYVIESLNRPNATGLITANICSLLQSLLTAADKSDYTAINFRDDNLSASYRIAYAESWDDGSPSGYTSDYIQLASTYYVTYTARQLGQKFGGNMAEFVPFRNSPAKWLSDFSVPVYSVNFPFDIGFIYGDDLAGKQIYYKLTLLDINQNLLPSQDTIQGYLLNEDGSFLLNTDGSKLIISEVSPTGIPIAEHVGLNRLLIDFTFDDEVYYFKIGLFYDNDDLVPVQVLNDQIVRVDKECDYNSVYLRWLGLTGSWNYYRFIFNQEITLDVQNATIIKRYISDWENQDTIEDVIQKDASQKMQVHAEDMTVEEIRGCRSMKYSPKVQMLVSSSPVKWQTIILNTATFAEEETNMGQYPFAVTFNLPSVNIQTQ